MPIQTPSQTIGPFFHYGLIFGGENILVNDQSSGPRIQIQGRVFDGDGEVVEDAMIEIWQADAQGYYDHPADPDQARADAHFHGFGRSDTVDEGRFYFKTVKPGVAAREGAAGHAPYVNVRVFSRGMLIHAVTRLYFCDEPANETDPVLQTIDVARRQTLIAQLLESEDLPTYLFDIRLQGAEETVFFDP